MDTINNENTATDRTYSANDRARFAAKVLEAQNGCILWTGGRRSGEGYGAFRHGGRDENGGENLSAHRASYEMAFGPIPEGQIIRHSCDTKACVNPDHLIAGTSAENKDDTKEWYLDTPLSPTERGLVLFWDEAGWSAEETAAWLSVNVRTVRDSLQRSYRGPAKPFLNFGGDAA